MKIYMLKTFLATIAILLAIPTIQAQFDDVYYDPDLLDSKVTYFYNEPEVDGTFEEEEVLYYDNDEYAYYEDDDFYYSTRIRRFYQPYIGFGFYDPIYIGYNYYDPFAYDYYGYPQSNFYLSFGFGVGFGSYYNNWYNPYYGYNNWYYPPYTYWGGCNNYYPYGGYYNYCPPVGCYNGIVNTHVNYGNSGNYPGSYYGPRVTGNTSTSPRGPVTIPGSAGRPSENVVTAETGSKTVNGVVSPGNPGRPIPSTSPEVTEGGVKALDPTIEKGNVANGDVRQVPIDREITRESTADLDKRPVFRPDLNKYQPYPTSGRSTPGTSTPRTDSPAGRNDSPLGNPSESPSVRSNPSAQVESNDQVPIRTDQTEGYRPPNRTLQERPSYSPPRHNDRTEHAAPQRENDRPSYSPPSHNSEPRSNDRPSYSPPTRSESQGGSNRSGGYSPSSSGRDNSSSGNRSSGGQSGSSSSPRGRG